MKVHSSAFSKNLEKQTASGSEPQIIFMLASSYISFSGNREFTNPHPVRKIISTRKVN
jgi:hypothetical protein